jgi:hypothetical protein
MNETLPRRKKGCLFFGSITLIIMLVLLCLGLLFGLRMAKKMRENYTEPQPSAIPTAPLTAAQTKVVQRKLEDFRLALRSGRANTPLELSADEINSLIAHDPALKALNGRLHVLIQGEKLSGQISMRMGELGLPVFQDRYLNAVAELDVSVRNGTARLVATNILVRGKPLPEVYLNQIQRENLGKALNADPDAQELLGRIGEVRLQGGRLIVSPATNSVSAR